MVRTGGKGPISLNAMPVRIAFLVFLTASLLSASNPASRLFPPCSLESPVPPPVAAVRMPDTATVGLASEALPRYPESASDDLAVWWLYLHSATPEVSGYALISAADPLPDTGPGAPALWSVPSGTTARPTLVSYRPHAPPA